MGYSGRKEKVFYMYKEISKLIKNKCGTIKAFCEEVGYSYTGTYRILKGERDGEIEFWKKTKDVLKLDSAELWRYMSYYKKNKGDKK